MSADNDGTPVDEDGGGSDGEDPRSIPLAIGTPRADL